MIANLVDKLSSYARLAHHHAQEIVAHLIEVFTPREVHDELQRRVSALEAWVRNFEDERAEQRQSPAGGPDAAQSTAQVPQAPSGDVPQAQGGGGGPGLVAGA